jgi:hypothetical protein
VTTLVGLFHLEIWVLTSPQVPSLQHPLEIPRDVRLCAAAASLARGRKVEKNTPILLWILVR